jgi:hypothetical protein
LIALVFKMMVDELAAVVTADTFQGEG